MVTNEQFRAAKERAEEKKRLYPQIVRAKYDPKLRQIILILNSNAWFGFSPDNVQGLEGANATQLEEMEISPSGFGVHFPQLDADVYLPALLQGHFGSSKWMAARLGAAGGSVKSKAKTAASRANGKLGGRPRKSVAS
jgi:hypothetical protein